MDRFILFYFILFCEQAVKYDYLHRRPTPNANQFLATKLVDVTCQMRQPNLKASHQSRTDSDPISMDIDNAPSFDKISFFAAKFRP